MSDSCLSLSNVIRQRRHFDLLGSVLGLVISSLHLIVLLYIKYARAGRGFELLLTQSALSLATLISLVYGCLLDLCLVTVSPLFAFFRAHIWLFIVNALMAAYSFIIIAMCADRFIAMNHPVYYRIRFVQTRMRVAIMAGCCLLAAILDARWFVYYIVVNNAIVENVTVTDTPWYNSLRTACYIVQYFGTGVCMIALSVANVRRLRALDRAHQDDHLRMNELARNQWTRNHQTIAKICVIQAASFVLCNWPYGLIDYFYTDELANTTWYATLELLINLGQIIYMQLNLFFFAYCSKIYRSTLLFLLRRPFLFCSDWIRNHWPLIKAQGVRRLMSDSSTTITYIT